MGEEKKRMSLIQIAGLLLFLVILPAGSWYYLQSGYNHRKASLAELQQLGTVSAFELADQNGDTFYSEDMQKRVVIAGFLPEEVESQTRWAERLHKLHEQFDERNDILFLLFADSASLNNPGAFLLQNDLTDSLQWTLLVVDKSEMRTLATEGFHLPDPDKPGYLALVDTSRMVRRHYDPLDNQQMGRLIEHITIVMPKLADPDIVFKREKEK